MKNVTIYLGGDFESAWRDHFKSKVLSSLIINDPFVRDYYKLNKSQKAEQKAKEMHLQEVSKIAVFYLDFGYFESDLLEIGYCVGRGKQVVVCDINKCSDLRLFCEYHGVIVVDSLEQMIHVVNECSDQTCKICF